MAGLMGCRTVLDVRKKRYVPLPGIDHWSISGLTRSIVNTELPRELGSFDKIVVMSLPMCKLRNHWRGWKVGWTGYFRIPHLFCPTGDSKVRRGSSIEPIASYCCPDKMTHISRYSWGWNSNKCIGFQEENKGHQQKIISWSTELF